MLTEAKGFIDYALLACWLVAGAMLVGGCLYKRYRKVLFAGIVVPLAGAYLFYTQQAAAGFEVYTVRETKHGILVNQFPSFTGGEYAYAGGDKAAVSRPPGDIATVIINDTETAIRVVAIQRSASPAEPIVAIEPGKMGSLDARIDVVGPDKRPAPDSGERPATDINYWLTWE